MPGGQGRKTMNWDAISAIAEAVGAIAVVISLVYVAVQIRQNTEQSAHNARATELAAFERNIEASNRLRELLILHPDLAELFVGGSADFKALEPSDRFRFGLLMRNVFMAIQGAYIRQMTLGEGPLEGSAPDRIVDELISNAGVREWLASGDFDWRPSFRNFVDERLRQFAQRDAS